MQGELSPLPPTEQLRKLFELLKDNENTVSREVSDQSARICWILLRQNILVYLGGIIGADGKGAYVGRGRPSSFPSQRSTIQVSNDSVQRSFEC